MIGIPFKGWVNAQYGTTQADKIAAANDIGISSSQVYKMMADGKYYVYETDKVARIYKLNFEIKVTR